MKKFKVEYLTKEEAGEYFNYGYTGQWSDFFDLIEAETAEEAEELAADWLTEHGMEDVEKNVIFRTHEID